MVKCDRCGNEDIILRFKDFYFFLILLIILGVCLIILFNQYILLYEHDALHNLEPAKLSYDLGGLSWNNGFYCVNTKGFSKNQIEEIDRHEYCHILVHDDYKHFCNQ